MYMQPNASTFCLVAGLVGSRCFAAFVVAQLRVGPAVSRRGERGSHLRGCGEQEDVTAGAAGGALAVSGAGCGECDEKRKPTHVVGVGVVLLSVGAPLLRASMA